MTTTINADNGVVSGSAGLKSSADSSGVLALQTNGTTAVTVGTDQSILMTGAPSIGGAGYGMGMGFRNRIINGAMVIDQRNAGASVTETTTGPFVTDRFAIDGSSSSKFTGQQSSTAPAGFTNSLVLTSSAATSVGSTDYYRMYHGIEGYNIADLGWGTANAKSVTLSFWVRSSLTGTFGGVARNNATDRIYPFSYTISAANTWEQKSITIAGDTSGTWLTTNGMGIQIIWSMGCGTSRQGTAGAWTSTTGIFTCTGETQLVATNGATFYITGVQLEKGSTATAFDYRPYTTELQLCQRYLPAFVLASGEQAFASGQAYNTTVCIIPLTLPVSARVNPTGLVYTGTISNLKVYAGSTGISLTALVINGSASNTTAALNATVASVTTGVPVLFTTPVSASGTIYFTGCEL